MNLIQKIRAEQVLSEENLQLKVTIKHSNVPETIVGDRKFTLIFPKFILDYTSDKDIDKLFVGVINKKRSAFLDNFKDALVINSDRGRNADTKIKDDEYFKLMGRSKFVLCPNGDFVWTYRFFEAILVSAIPIIQENCELYEGYKFFNLNDDYTYNQEWIDFNLNKVKKELMWT